MSTCNATHNRCYNRSGYSPLQRVFGYTHRLPGELCSDDTYVPDAIAGEKNGGASKATIEKIFTVEFLDLKIVSLSWPDRLLEILSYSCSPNEMFGK